MAPSLSDSINNGSRQKRKQEKSMQLCKKKGRVPQMYMYIIPYGGVLVFGFEIEQKSLTISFSKKKIILRLAQIQICSISADLILRVANFG